MKKKILFFTGKRGGYGALTNIINLFKKDKKFQVILVLSDMHLKNQFGKTLSEVKKKYRNIISIDIGKKSNSNLERTKSLSLLINKFSIVLTILNQILFYCWVIEVKHWLQLLQLFK